MDVTPAETEASPGSVAHPRAAEVAHPERSNADRAMRRVLRLPVDGPTSSIFGAHGAFSTSIAVSAARCTVTYILLPLLSPILNLSGTLGPILGLVVGAVSMVAIVYSIRRFFAADHRYRWHYAAVGGAILCLLVVQAVIDISHLLG
jgi:hypothetical protein